MVDIATLSRPTSPTFGSPFTPRLDFRPLPLRTNSVQIEQSGFDAHRDGSHVRHKSTSTARAIARLAVPPAEKPGSALGTRLQRVDSVLDSEIDPADMPNAQHSPPKVFHRSQAHPAPPTPPVTPCKDATAKPQSTKHDAEPAVTSFDFSKIDYEIERAKLLGTGLWSRVYRAEPRGKSPRLQRTSPLTPPTTPFNSTRAASTASLLAVKVPIRSDANAVLHQEAETLTQLQRHIGCNQYIVPFLGLDARNGALVSEAVIGGSLEDLTSRLRHMTELSRHLELVSIFPGLANDLISGLEFIHASGFIHADIKPANILLDISDHYSLPAPVIRARYIDFSAAFPASDPDACTNAGGTWAFMAPEQMRMQKDLSTPTFASDVWSLGITLLSVIVGGSPYLAASGGNAFREREAIKAADPLAFARMDPVAAKRMAAVQDFIDCCKLALRKDREKRSSAHAWKGWLVSQHIGA